MLFHRMWLKVVLQQHQYILDTIDHHQSHQLLHYLLNHYIHHYHHLKQLLFFQNHLIKYLILYFQDLRQNQLLYCNLLKLKEKMQYL